MNFFEKLQSDTARYWDKPFLKAAVAVCAISALADGKVSLNERYRVDAVNRGIKRGMSRSLLKMRCRRCSP